MYQRLYQKIGQSLGQRIVTPATLLNQDPMNQNQILQLFGSSIVGYWPLDDVSGSVANDVSFNGFDAAYAGTVTLNQSAFKNRKCTNFNQTGALNIYSAGLAADINMQEGFLSIWLKCNDDIWGEDSGYFAAIGVDANNRLMIRCEVNNLISLIFIAGGVTSAVTIDAPYGNKSWWNLGMQWSVTSNFTRLYVSGISAKTYATCGTWVGGISTNWAHFLATQAAGNKFNAQALDAIVLNQSPLSSDITKMINPIGLVLFEGDSRSALKGWNGRAISKMYDENEIVKYGYIQAATSGATTATISESSRVASVNANIIATKKNILVVFIGVNDSLTKTAQQIYDSIKLYCQNARTAGWNKIVVCTEIDSIYSGWSVKYLDLNVLLRADYSFADILADLGARTELQTATDATYFTDGTHLTAAGYAIVGDVVGAALRLLK